MGAKKTKEKPPISRKAKSPKKTAKWQLHLFVAGMSPRSQDAIANIHKLCEKHLIGRYKLEVIDIHQHPLSASVNQILAVPTLIKKLPPPLRKFVGDMSKTEKILAGLDLRMEERND